MTTLVDFDRLRSFTDGDPGLEAELFGLFLVTAERYVAGLEAALADAAAWRALSHSLKGAAGNIGALAMAELAAAAERAPPDPTRLEALQSTFAATRRCLDRHLEDSRVAAVGWPARQTAGTIARCAE